MTIQKANQLMKNIYLIESLVAELRKLKPEMSEDEALLIIHHLLDH